MITGVLYFNYFVRRFAFAIWKKNTQNENVCLPLTTDFRIRSQKSLGEELLKVEIVTKGFVP